MPRWRLPDVVAREMRGCACRDPGVRLDSTSGLARIPHQRSDATGQATLCSLWPTAPDRTPGQSAPFSSDHLNHFSPSGLAAPDPTCLLLLSSTVSAAPIHGSRHLSYGQLAGGVESGIVTHSRMTDANRSVSSRICHELHIRKVVPSRPSLSTLMKSSSGLVPKR